MWYSVTVFKVNAFIETEKKMSDENEQAVATKATSQEHTILMQYICVYIDTH